MSTSFTQVFGGTTIYPSDVSYLALTLGANIPLEWPLEATTTDNVVARIMDITATGAYSITLPDATQTAAGQTILFNNLSASSSSFYVKDFAGNILATVGVGEQWQIYLAATTTAAGTWRVFRYGASTATVQASALAGYGLTVTSNTLSQSLPVTTFNTSPRTLLVTDRSSALVWTGTGIGTLNLMASVVVGNNFFIAVRNSGGGDLTIDPAGTETIDGAATLVLRPGESAQLITDGLVWFTLGLGQEAVFAFDFTSIPVTGGTYTLAGSELNRIAYQFTGTLTSDCYIVVPSTVQQYWVDNATTGSYGLYLQTAGGTPVGAGQGTRGIYYCNGTNVVDADTSTISLPVSVSDGGTGLTNYTIGDLLYASNTQVLSRLADVAVGNVLRSGGVGVAPAWGKVALTTDVNGTLPAANGGTGLASYTTGDLVFASGATTLSSLADAATGNALISGGVGEAPSYGKIGLATHVSGTLPVVNGGTGDSTYTDGQLLIGNTTGNTLTKATLTAGTGITVTNGSGSVTVTNSAPLSNFTAAISTAAPNDTVSAASLTAAGAATNIDAVLSPKGTGALLADVPDNTVSGGNKRGQNAVDLQNAQRQLATQVASGAFAVIGGGFSNTASGLYAAVFSGSLNSATNTNAVVMGGRSNTASRQYSAVLGGDGNLADGNESVASGAYASARGIRGSRIHSAGGAWSGGLAVLGSAQTGTYVLRRETTTATTLNLSTSGSNPSQTGDIVTLPDNATYTFDILVTARRTDATNESAGYRFVGVIDRQASAATTALVGTVTKTVIAEDTAAWDVDVYVDTTLGGFSVQATGEAAKTIRWVAVVNTAEVMNG